MDARVALVTGAGRGLGLEVARQLAGLGYAVLISSRDARRSTEVARSLASVGDVRPVPVAHDVADELAAVRVAGLVERDPGRLDVVVNNAGAPATWDRSASMATVQEIRETLDVDVVGPWVLTNALLPLLRTSPAARVVNVSSAAGSHGDPTNGLAATSGRAAAHAVSMAAVNALTAVMAAELADDGILVNAACPGRPEDRTIEEAAASVVWAATLPDGAPTGGFFRDGVALAW